MFARTLSLWLPVAAWAAAIFASSSASSLPALPPQLTDKMAHGAAYAVLAAAFIRAFAGARWTGVTPGVAAAAVIASTLYAASDEVHQMFVVDRTADAFDVAADFAGSAVAAAAALVIGRWRQARDTGAGRI
jgi:VanZ family protein